MTMKTRWNYLKGRCHYLNYHPVFRRSPLRIVFRLLLWRMRCLLNIPAVISLPCWDARFFIPPWWGGEGTTMIFAARQEYENELRHLERFVSNGNVVVDAGASCGIYTIAAAKLVGEKGRVIAFEPGVRSASVLIRNIELNGLNNVRLYREALSDRVGRARLYHHRGPVASSMAVGDSNKHQFDEITTTTLDSMLKQEGLDRVDFLKMDIEGAEELALRGGKTLFAKFHPVIVFEMNLLAATRFGLDADGAWRYLQGLSYRFFILDKTGKLNPLESPPNNCQREFRNIIAM